MLDPNASGRVVGFRQLSGGIQPLIARYSLNGSAIRQDGVFTDTRLSGSARLYGVAVTTTNDLWATGTYTLTEHYDGLSWEIVPAELVGSAQQILYGVAVDPVRDGAWAVGYYTNGGGFLPLVERYARPVTPDPPNYTVSRYMVTTTEAYNDGQKACAYGSGIIVLDFGQPAVSNTIQGSILLGDHPKFVSTNEISTTVEQFAEGYYKCLRPGSYIPPITLAIGTNNDKTGTSVMTDSTKAQAHGQAWAQMVKDVNTTLILSGYTSISIAAGFDAETGWSGPTTTLAWAQGYDAVNGRLPYYNYGACEGCPPAAGMNGWSVEQVYSVSWGITAAYPLPEIYATSGINAQQWQQMSLYAYSQHGFRMTIKGAFTQYDACQTNPPCFETDNMPTMGWAQLWQALNFDLTGQRTYESPEPRWSTDITWRK